MSPKKEHPTFSSSSTHFSYNSITLLLIHGLDSCNKRKTSTRSSDRSYCLSLFQKSFYNHITSIAPSCWKLELLSFCIKALETCTQAQKLGFTVFQKQTIPCHNAKTSDPQATELQSKAHSSTSLMPPQASACLLFGHNASPEREGRPIP
jgi:hypothetical protein